MSRRAVLGLLAALALCGAARAESYDLDAYGRQCAAAIAEVPEFDCMAGEIVPITVDGRVPASYAGVTECDRPAMAPYPEGGECSPWSRALVLRNDTAQISAVCRRAVLRDKDSPLFDEIDIVAHSRANGSTCWFKATGTKDKPLDGRRVPSPTAGGAAAKAFWHTPEQVAADNCGDCHDSDPFMYSPWIGQTTAFIGDPQGQYRNDIGPPFQAWTKPLALAPRGNACIGCHRIGSENTCRVAMLQSTGAMPIAAQDAWSKLFPQSHWMPAGQGLTAIQWETTYARSMAELQRCCEDPHAAGCYAQPIHEIR
ncbi:MAG TPA: hypothetical protein VEH84_06830 [Alphaproteobacteria bacterium]|nr:hypothetical protein [Alphaproteobacteria bacterium]